MRNIVENGTLALMPEGRIDSANAIEFEREIAEALAANPGTALVVDAEKLEYISSAGLRVLMKLRKQVGKALPVVNVSPEVYDIFDMTGFTELLNAGTLAERIQENPSRLEELAVASARLLRQLHETEVPEGQLPEATKLLHGTIDRVSADFTPDELAKLHALYDSIPRMNRFIHNDYHPKNVMESNGELILIDLGDAGAGNPLIDLIHSYMVFNIIGAGVKARKADEMSFIDLTYDQLERFWDAFIVTYCGDAETAKRMNAKLEPFGQMMYYTVAMAHPRLPKENHKAYADSVREGVLSRYDVLLGSLTMAI